MTLFRNRLDTGSFWEDEVRKYLEGLGYTVRKYECFDGYYNELPQHYVYIDGSTNNPHPDFILSLDENRKYVEVKSRAEYFENSGYKFLGFESFHFESYLKLSLWKKLRCDVIFTVHTADNAWYEDNVENMNKTKKKFSFVPNRYFWNIKDLKRIK